LWGVRGESVFFSRTPTGEQGNTLEIKVAVD